MTEDRATHRWALALLAALSLLCVDGCALRRGALRVDSRRIQALQRQVVRETRCPTVVTTMLTAEVAQVHGCGWVREYSMITLGRGRGRWRPVGPVWERAASEMQCPMQQLTVTAPAPTQRVVSGCGRAAEYGLSCAAECIWTMRRWQVTGGPPGGGSAAFASAPSAVPAPPAATEGATAAAEPTAGGEATAGEDAGVPAASTGAAASATTPSATAPSATGPSATGPSATTAPSATIAQVGTVTDPAAFAVPDPPRPGSAEASLRAFLDERRAAIRGCTGPGRTEIVARWTASGDVSFGLTPPLAGTTAEVCVQGALGTARFAGASAEGEVRHTLL